MDKLQPLIKHRYWICFGLAVIFVVAGWWMASGAIAVEILARKDSVEKSFDKAKQGVNEPNVFWVEQARKENETDSAAYKSASAQLLQRQKDARRWPDVLASDMKGVSYRGDIKNSTTRGRWASIYRNEIERLLSIVKPYKNGEGLVVVDVNKITHKPFNSWRTAYPSSTEVWDAQEDIWLLQSLLTSIARVNEGATRITESQVRQIFKLTLRGGDRNATSGASGGGMGGMGGMTSEMMGGMGMVMGGPGGDGGGGMGGGTGAAAGTHPGKEFEGNAGADILSEEFGSAGNAAAGMGGMGGMGGSMMGSGMVMGMDSMGSGGGMPGAGAPAEEKRYVDDGADLGYKTRAFLLDVVIRDDQLPNLLASLTNSDFPVEIVRVDILSKMVPQRSGGGMGGAPDMDGGLMTGMGMGGNDMAASSFGMEGGIGMPGMTEGEFGGDTSGLVMPGDESFDAAYTGGPGAGLMMPGAGGMPGGMGGMGGMGSRGKDVLQVAMADPLLIHVKIGGLMTLYQSAQEADAEAATAEVDQAQAPAPAPPIDEAAGAVDENGQPVDPGLLPTDPNMTDSSETPSTESATATAPVTEDAGSAPSDSSEESSTPQPSDSPASTEETTPPAGSDGAEEGSTSPDESTSPEDPAPEGGAGSG